MSGLLNSLRSPNGRQSDDHGVAELLEAVSKRSMSCSQEEKQELDQMSRRVREHNHKPNAVEMLQKKLSGMQIGGSNHSSNNNSRETALADDYNSDGIVSPTITMSSTKPKMNIPKISSPLNNLGKDIARGFLEFKTHLSQAKIQVEERLHAHDLSPQRRQQPSRQSQRNKPETAMLREFDAAPTIVVLPPLEDPKMVPPTISQPREKQASSSEPVENQPEATEQNVFVISDEDDAQAVDEKPSGTADAAVEGEEKKQDL